METFWLCAIAVMVALYVVLDGFDIGAGIVHFLVGRTDSERRSVIRSIGPVWDGNEVWLLAAGGVLYFAFPQVYASGFSGFYLPLMILLWLLIARGISVEFRHHIESPLWRSFWDGGFCFSSILIAIIFGAALGNVVRGVPFDEKGFFFTPLWTDFRAGPQAGVLDWYTVSVGLAALCTLAHHGALWVALKTEGPVNVRCRRVARASWWGVAALAAAITVFTFQVQPQAGRNLAAMPWGLVFPALAAAGLAGSFVFLRKGSELKAFLSSSVHIAGMLTSAVFGIYPNVLPACNDPARSLTAASAKAADYGLRIGLVWWIIGIALAAGYFAYVYRQFRGKVRLEDEGY